MLPALSGILPDSFSEKHIRLTGLDSQHHPNRVHGNRRQHAGGSGQNARALHSFLFANFIVQPPRQQPAHAEHIDCRAESPITQTVFALAEATRPMVHRNLHKPVASAFDQRGNETVHSLEWNEGADTFPPHRLERATSVTHAVLCETAANRIRNPTRQPLQTRVSTLRPIATDEIGGTRNFSKKLWNISRIILQIAVDKNRSCATRCFETGVNRRALPGIFFETNHAHVRLWFNTFYCAIDRSVVDKDSFVIEVLQRCAQFCLQDADALFFVKKRNYDGNRR